MHKGLSIEPPAVVMSGRRIGRGESCFVIAEAGINHNGNMAIAMKMIDAAKDAGADAIKFQSFKADKLATAKAPKARYQKRSSHRGESQLEMLRRVELSPMMHQQLIACCRKKHIQFLSSPFEEESADLLEYLNVPIFKIPSGELTNLPFLRHIACKRKPMIVSTGMATLHEVRVAVNTIRRNGNPHVILLHCTSNYPANPKDVNLRAMDTLSSTFRVPVGYSDHTLGIIVALAAVARGACVIEKHLTLDHGMEGPDHRASSEPEEFAALVRGIRRVESALGHGRKVPALTEHEMVRIARKSLVAAQDIPSGSRLTLEAIAIKRPGTGLPPSMVGQVLGRKAKKDIPADTLLRLDLLS